MEEFNFNSSVSCKTDRTGLITQNFRFINWTDKTVSKLKEIKIYLLLSVDWFSSSVHGLVVEKPSCFQVIFKAIIRSNCKLKIQHQSWLTRVRKHLIWSSVKMKTAANSVLWLFCFQTPPFQWVSYIFVVFVKLLQIFDPLWIPYHVKGGSNLKTEREY